MSSQAARAKTSDECETGLCAPTTSTSHEAPPSTSASSSGAAAQASSSAPQQPEDPMDTSTFVKPLGVQAIQDMPSPSVVIEFCDRCRWLHRAAWVQTELFLTFSPPLADAAPTKASGGAVLHGITLLPLRREETGGRFRVWLISEAGKEKEMSLVWDRKLKGAFPELKELKQLIRDRIAPQHSLGHSDRKR